MKKLANGRYNGEVGIERVNRDGKIEVLKPSDVEVTVTDRMRWYNKATLDRRGNNTDEIYDVDKNDGGNPLELKNLQERTRQPRPHQYSVERRLQELREPNSTEAIRSDATLSQAMAMTFYEIVKEVESDKMFDNNQVIRVSQVANVGIEDVIRLKAIADKRPDLVKAFRTIGLSKTADFIPGKGGAPKCNNCKGGDVPGVSSPGNDGSAMITKEGDPGEELGEEELKSIGLELALAEPEANEVGISQDRVISK